MPFISAPQRFCSTGTITALRRIRSFETRMLASPAALAYPKHLWICNGKRNLSISSPWRRRNFQRITFQTHRTFSIESIPSILVPPTVFVGLVLALWTWKCLMMVIFQDKIIYMPSMPPFARSERMDDYTAICKPVLWEQKHIKSLDGTRIALCIGQIAPETHHEQTPTMEVVICYFQGNGSSLPPRLPILSNVLKSLQAKALGDGIPVRYTLIGLSYRGYWTSSGRASQAGIELDARALLDYVSDYSATSETPRKIILWGQSIGSGVATNLAANFISKTHNNDEKTTIDALVLETPFSSVKQILIALYPQKWLPYRYLWPFLWNRWDSEAALREISLSSAKMPRVLVLPATRDEVVPAEEADKLERLCEDLHIPFERKNVEGALHNEATTRRDGQAAIAKFIDSVARQ